MIGIITAIAGPVVKLATSFIDRKKEKTKAKHERDLAVIKNQARLAQSEKEFNHEWEMANLQEKDKGLRNMSFILFTSPVIITVIFPDYAKQMYANLDMVPEWLLHIWFYMIAGVWGIASLKNSVTEIVSNMRKK